MIYFLFHYQSYAIEAWIYEGCDPFKLTLGFGAYGRSYSQASGWPTAGTPQPYTLQAGYWAYFEVS